MKYRKIRIERPSDVEDFDGSLWVEAQKYARLIPLEPDPNLGRVHEIKEEIDAGLYPAREVIDETAARLAARFMKKL